MWLACPRRYLHGRGAYWTFQRYPDEFYAECSLIDSYIHAKTYPDDDRQCLRVEGDLMWAPGMPVNRPAVKSS
jgi:hypothetical protein